MSRRDLLSLHLDPVKNVFYKLKIFRRQIRGFGKASGALVKLYARLSLRDKKYRSECTGLEKEYDPAPSTLISLTFLGHSLFIHHRPFVNGPQTLSQYPQGEVDLLSVDRQGRLDSNYISIDTPHPN
jgi:hypothetical protein